MKRLRSLARRLVGIAKPLMLTLAVAGLIAAVKGYSSIRAAEDYTDQGVYTFTAYRVWSTAETRYSGHRRVERIVYKLDYRSPGKKYKYTQDVINKTTGKEYIQEKRQVERRVLSINGENKYITVVFMTVFCHLVAVYIEKFSNSAFKKLQMAAFISAVLMILSFVGEYIAYQVIN